MASLRGRVMSVVAVGLLVSLCLGLSPGGRVRKVSRLCGGLLLFLAVMTPLTRLDVTGALTQFRTCCDRLSQPTQSLAETGGTLTRELVTARSEAYLRAQARDLGAEVTVCVTCRDRDGLPVPAEVTFTGSLTQLQREQLTGRVKEAFGLAGKQVHFSETEGTS